MPEMFCPKCAKENDSEDSSCAHCGSKLAVAVLEVIRGDVDRHIHFLKPRSYTVGRARHNDLPLIESSVSKEHARLIYRDGHFEVEDLGSRHGVFVNAARVESAALENNSLLQLGNVTLKFSSLDQEDSTDHVAQLPWVEQQQLLLSVVQTLNSTLVLSDVLEQVLDAVMRMTRAERGFLLLADTSAEAEEFETVAGLRVRVGRHKDGSGPVAQSISTSVVGRALQGGQIVATGNAMADPSLAEAQSIVRMELRTIVCIPLRSPRAGSEPEDGPPHTLGALYVDNHQSSAPFSADSLSAAEALARHAALAIENAQMFEREKRSNEELRQAQSQLLQAEKLATIGQMAAGIAHELNTPLTYIMGNVELVRGQGLGRPEAHMLDSIQLGAEKIEHLAKSLLAFSRPAEDEPAPLAANEVIERCLELCHYQLMKGGVRLEKQLAPDLPEVMGVRNQLEMALINLTVNAIQAMSSSSRRELKVSSRLQDGELEIAIADTGAGIPEDVRQQIFEPFFTTKPEGHGTGLGLPTVLMAVERHKGTLNLSSEADAGTTFTVRLPTVS
jgi:signal transduction histidine kinase